MDHAFAAPVLCALGPSHVADAGSAGSLGTGSQVQRRAPVRASKPRTSPLAASMLLLSATAEPTTTTPFTTVGGEVSSYSDANVGGLRRPLRSCTCPRLPKSVHGAPLAASSAIKRVSIVATNTLSAHTAVGAALLSSQSATPRFAKSPNPTALSTFGSKRQRSTPVVGSSANTL